MLCFDAHADEDSGEIIYGENRNGESVSDELDIVCYYLSQLRFGLIYFQLVDSYMGSTLRTAVLELKGIKGLVLLSCGPAWNSPKHFNRVKSLVAK